MDLLSLRRMNLHEISRENSKGLEVPRECNQVMSSSSGDRIHE
jgi:hypothetical protein